MAIIKFIPEVKKIVDYRNSGGGFYVATCDSCGTEFYPKRGNAKFCNDKCAQNSFREKIASGAVPKKTVKKTTISGQIVKGQQNVRNWVEMQNIPIRGLKRLIQELQVGDDMGWKGVTIKRISAIKYEVG